MHDLAVEDASRLVYLPEDDAARRGAGRAPAHAQWP